MRLVVFAHGSRDIRWQRPFDALTAGLKERLRAGEVCLAYMEFISPTLLDVAEEAVRDGKLQLLVLPFFLAAGAHLAEDIPVQVADAQMRFLQLEIKLLPPIGEHPRVKELFQEIACEYARA